MWLTGRVRAADASPSACLHACRIRPAEVIRVAGFPPHITHDKQGADNTSVNTPSTPTTNGGPLSPQRQNELAEADPSARKVLSAAKVAAFNGWTIGGAAALSLLFALSSPTALVVGSGLAIVAWNELRGRKLLLRFDPRGPRLLGWNQLGFMGLVVAYCLWSIYIGLTGTTELDALFKELESVTGSIGDLQTTLTLAVYGGVITGTIIFQGLNSLYYFTRTKHVQAAR